MQQIIDYIISQYQPLSIIVYGSYADGTNNENSDFDALVVTRSHEYHHDISCVCGVQLDVFVYPEHFFQGNFDPCEVLQIADGTVIFDTDCRGKHLQEQIARYAAALPRKTHDEIRNEIMWCRKMLKRALRSDTEGLYRWHWLLTDSLEIFCNCAKRRYTGPKKTLKWMENDYPEAFSLYTHALAAFTQESLERWVEYLESSL